MSDFTSFRLIRRLVVPVLAALALAAGIAAQDPSPTDVDAERLPAPVRRDGVTAGSSRVGFVDVELIIDNSRAVRRGLNSIDEQLSEQARAIDLKEREFRRLRFELDRQERVLTREERERRRQELIGIQEDVERLRFEMDRELQAKERLVEPVLEKMMLMIADVAEREGFDLVLRGEVVIYGNKTADLTEAVVREIDSREDEILAVFRPAPEPARDDRPTTAPAPTPGPPESLPLIP